MRLAGHPNGERVTFQHHITHNSPGMYAALHCHNYFELIYLVSGDIVHVVEGRKYRLRPGDLVLVKPSTYHYLQILSGETYERYKVHFDPKYHGVEAANHIPREMEVVNISQNATLVNLFEKMDMYSKVDEENFDTLMRLLLNELFLHLQLFPLEQQKEDTLSPILTKALEYINENLFTIADVNEVAEALFISESYLFRLFRTSLRQSPKKYIRDKRLLAAQRRIRRGMTPTAACKECGFKEYATFFRSYTAFFGHSPSQDKAPQELL